MNYKCEKCHDTGSTNPYARLLDCISCEAAADRAALEVFIKTSPRMEEHDLAWAIHQRALAMAPKQEAPEPVAQDCGACLGTGWVSRDADIGTEQECFSCDGSGKSDDAAPAAANGALTDAQVHQGVMALLGCTSSDVEDYSPKLYEGYANDVRRVYAALSGAKGN